MIMTDYPSNITDNQWNSIENFFDPAKRKRKHRLIEIMNAILYTLVSGCQWRMLPKDFPPYNTVYYYFRKWKYEGSFEQAMFELHKTVRVAAGREECPSLGIVDSKSVRSSNHVDSDRGIDGNKKVKGRKVHICVDVLGLPLAIAIHAANIHDSDGAEYVFNEMIDRFPRLKSILADGGYRGVDVSNAAKKHGWELNVVLRPDECPKKFIVLPKRWIVERTFSWLEKCRRLASDFEFFSNSLQAMVQLAFIRLMLNRFIV